MKKDLILALDCGTTGNRAILFDVNQRIIASSYREFTQYYPKPGWVEHDAEEIWSSVKSVMRGALKKVSPRRVAALGLTNQRETFLFWNRKTGKPLHHAIVWQCRRSDAICEHLRKKGFEKKIHRDTGLFLDPYFSATKIRWAVEHHAALSRGLKTGRILFGTIDTWIIWKLTQGCSFSTDPTNASRTMLYHLRKGMWDKRLCRLFRIPLRALPQILPSSSVRGHVAKSVLGASVPIAGVAGDQQAASFAQGCFKRGIVKNTYGTGLFVVAQTGRRIKISPKLVTTVAASVGPNREYALEGSVFIAGAAIQWLRDGLHLIKRASESEAMAKKLDTNEGVYLVPALAGLGCPYWDAKARGLVIGLTRRTRKEHFLRAALESIAYQTQDVLEILRREIRLPIRKLQVDGGAVVNRWLMQFQADVSQCEVERPVVADTTALGAAGLAGIAIGFWQTRESFIRKRKVDRIFKPKPDHKEFKQCYIGWQRAVQRAKAWAE
jgi:glycerol kinase